MSILDISNWTIDEINNSINIFKDTSLTDIGMVNCDIDSINIVGGITTATLWIDEDIGIDGYTGTAPLKIYKEDKVEIKLNSPLLEGDTIEVKDGKLCHYHKMSMVVLDGSEDWIWDTTTSLPNTNRASIKKAEIDSNMKNNDINTINFCNNVLSINAGTSSIDLQTIQVNTNYIFLRFFKIYAESLEELKIYLNNNPIIYIYELIEPYYEDITPLQSSIILKTFLESSMTIDTNLPIKTNVSYRTNVPSISTLSNRVAEVSESDNVIHNLINIIDDEVDE